MNEEQARGGKMAEVNGHEAPDRRNAPVAESTCNSRMNSFEKQHIDLKDSLKEARSSLKEIIETRLNAMDNALILKTEASKNSLTTTITVVGLFFTLLQIGIAAVMGLLIWFLGRGGVH